MKFTYSKWEKFCKELSESGMSSVTAESLLLKPHMTDSVSKRFIVIKHDVESRPSAALALAQIESRYGHRATYYVQANLMNDSNRSLFKQIQDLGHEVTYHHDVIDGADGDIQAALDIYQKNLIKFEEYGFEVKTTCQHGNPASIYDNRNFFRSPLVQEKYPEQSDVMVDFPTKIGRTYTYVSDVGMEFKVVLDPFNVEGLTEDKQYQVVGDIEQLLKLIVANPEQSYIISAHPHRYNKSSFGASIRKIVFTVLKAVAKCLFIIPGVKRLVFKNNTLVRYI